MDTRSTILQGTLDLMVLKTLDAMGPMHDYGLARRIEQISEDALLVNQGTIYLCLIRLVQKRWIAATWGTSENNRKAKFYAITRAGRKQLQAEVSRGHVDRLQDRSRRSVNHIGAAGINQRGRGIGVGGIGEGDILTEGGHKDLGNAVGRADRREATRLTRGSSAAAADVGKTADVASEAGQGSGVTGCVRRTDAADSGAVGSTQLENRSRTSTVLIGSNDDVGLAVAVQVTRADHGDTEVAADRDIRAVDLLDVVSERKSSQRSRSRNKCGHSCERRGNEQRTDTT